MYILIEGVEGVGKTSQTKLLEAYIKKIGASVVLTKEPGTHDLPLTMAMRGLMLDSRWQDQMPVTARELLSQAIRAIHMEKKIAPAIDEKKIVIQDRGMLSGIAYGTACGNSEDFIKLLMSKAVNSYDPFEKKMRDYRVTSLVKKAIESLSLPKEISDELNIVDTPLALEMNSLINDSRWEEEMTDTARELLSLAILSIHLEKRVSPFLEEMGFHNSTESEKQDQRWQLEGDSYVSSLMTMPHNARNPFLTYDKVVFLSGDVAEGLRKAKSAKQEFEAGDAIEAMGEDFMTTVNGNILKYGPMFKTPEGTRAFSVVEAYEPTAEGEPLKPKHWTRVLKEILECVGLPTETPEFEVFSRNLEDPEYFKKVTSD